MSTSEDPYPHKYSAPSVDVTVLNANQATIHLTVSLDELKEIALRADVEGLTITDWIKQTLYDQYTN